MSSLRKLSRLFIPSLNRQLVIASCVSGASLAASMFYSLSNYSFALMLASAVIVELLITRDVQAGTQALALARGILRTMIKSDNRGPAQKALGVVWWHAARGGLAWGYIWPSLLHGIVCFAWYSSVKGEPSSVLALSCFGGAIIGSRSLKSQKIGIWAILLMIAILMLGSKMPEAILWYYVVIIAIRLVVWSYRLRTSQNLIAEYP